MNRVTVKPELLRWARERVGESVKSLSRRYPKLDLWESGKAKPTIKQLEGFAKATHVSIGYLFLSEPPEEQVPIPDLRTVGNREVEQPSPNLLDTIYLCQQRQAWYQEFSRSVGDEPHRFVGSVRSSASIVETAEKMRNALDFDLDRRRECPTWTDALRHFIEQADDLGVLVMCSGIVGNNTRRKLDTEEFRGFALVDKQAPLVFINGADTKAAQMFTLAHELAHIWLGESALSDVSPAEKPSQRIELWCNRVAAEFLVPLAVLRRELSREDPLGDVAVQARRFKVSSLVILRRIYDTEMIDRNAFHQAYQEEAHKLRRIQRSQSPGGNFYLTQTARVSRRFASALITDTLEGQTLYRDAFQMLGIKKEKTFRMFGRHLGCAT